MSAKNYTFEHAGKKVSLPNFSEIQVGALRAARNATDEMDKAFIIFETVLDEKALAVIDAMTVAELADLISGWTAGAAVGESSES